MAVPKKRTTPSTRGQRRSHHALKPLRLSVCSHCGKTVPGHQVCPVCGYYRNHKVIEVLEKVKKKKVKKTKDKKKANKVEK